MKRITTFLFILFGAFSIQAQIDAELIINEFLLPSEEGVFRGFDFTSMEGDIEPMEESRPLITFSFEDIDDEFNLTLGYDLSFSGSEDNFAYIDYNIDLIGIYQVIASLYMASDAEAIDVYNQLNKYYATKLGLGTLESDGWTSFDGQIDANPYTVWIYLDEDEYGKYIRYELVD